MTTIAMLRPVVALALWTLLMLGLLAVRRFPAMRSAGIDLRQIRGGRGQDLEGILSGPAMWPSHNYAHLVEQPTIFYAVALALAIAGDASSVGLGLAWAYVVLRVLHSLYQVAINVVAVRFLLFVASTTCLFLLTLRAVALLFL